MKIDHSNYKKRIEALRKSGFTDREIKRLSRLPQKHADNPLDQPPSHLGRLRFVRWLVEHGRLTDWHI